MDKTTKIHSRGPQSNFGQHFKCYLVPRSLLRSETEGYWIRSNVWKVALLRTEFPRLILATEGFGARLGPILVRHSNDQNERIDRHEVTGYKVIFSAIMVNKYVLRGNLSFWFIHLIFIKAEPTTQWRKWIPWLSSRPALQGTEESKMGQPWIRWRNTWKLRGAVGTCCGNARKKGRDPRETKHVVMLGQPASVSIQI